MNGENSHCAETNETAVGNGDDHHEEEAPRIPQERTLEYINVSSRSMDAEDENDEHMPALQSDVELGNMKSSFSVERGNGRDAAYSVSFDGSEDVHLYSLDSMSMSSDEDEVNDPAGMTPNRRAPRPGLAAMRQSGVGASSRRIVDTPQRVSKTIDLETGREGARAQCAVIRDADERQPQMRRRRLKKRAQKAMRSNYFWGRRKTNDDEVASSHHNSNTSSHSSDENKKKRRFGSKRQLVPLSSRAHIPINDNTQYRLFSVDVDMDDEWGNFGFYGDLVADDDKGCGCFGFKPNQMVVSYLFWAFRSNFASLLVSAAMWFFSLTLFFALIIFAIGKSKPYCIHVNGYDFDSDGGAAFMDAYALSWTTFSTVGYGLIYPATSSTIVDARDCFAITIICTWESFIGILIASFWGAIFLSKVTRVSSFAQVTFSAPIVIRYGSGVGKEADDEDRDQSLSSGSELDVSDEPSGADSTPRVHRSELSKIPCPVLEFRVLNRLSGQKRGEIIDASMNIVASVDRKQVEDKGIPTSRKRKRGGKKKGKRSVTRGVKAFHDDEDLPLQQEWLTAQAKVRNMLQNARRSAISTEVSIAGDMSETTAVVSRKKFAKLYIESQENPFFKRVWVARHVLDQDSPLLKHEVKELVRLNNGHWPRNLNYAQAVRDSVKFDQILVSLSGTANADCNSVYSQKVYDYVDVCVGYKFVNVLYRDRRGNLNVDETLINDVVEQSGGGGEELEDRNIGSRSTHGQIFIL